MQLRLSASGRTAQQPKSYCTKLPCSKAQARYLSQNIGIETNSQNYTCKENYSTGSGSLAHATCVLRPAHNMTYNIQYAIYIYIYIYIYLFVYIFIYLDLFIYLFMFIFTYLYTYTYHIMYDNMKKQI